MMPGEISLVIELELHFLLTNIFIKFSEDWIKTIWFRERKLDWDPYFEKFKGHNSMMPGGISLVIELGLHFVLTNIFIKFSEDWIKTVWASERKRKCAKSKWKNLKDQKSMQSQFFWEFRGPLLQSALWDLADYLTWLSFCAKKYFHKVWWKLDKNYLN